MKCTVKYNMKAFAAGGGSIEGGLWSRVKVTKPEAFQRPENQMPRIFSEDILTMLGATTMGHQSRTRYISPWIRKVVDAAEFSFPCGDLSISLHEVAEYLIVPAWWQTSMITLLAVNMDSWKKLPDELKPLYSSMPPKYPTSWPIQNGNIPILKLSKQLKKAGTKDHQAGRQHH